MRKLCFIAMAMAALLCQAAPIVNSKTRLAVTGDSITEQKQYSRFIELYLMACAPESPEAVFQFGWGGDRAPGFAGRMKHDCLSFFNPTLLTTCYGMNDGNYRAYDQGTGNQYKQGMTNLVKNALDSKATVLVGGPGAVDTKRFRNDRKTADMYNETLSKLSDLAREIAQKNNLPFADVHKICIDAMAKAKADLGEDYIVMGGDGVHPGENGQLAMAFAFLKEMGFDGNIGSITWDLKGDVSVQGEHSAAAAGDGVLKVTSRRWPFCFTGDPKGQTALAMSRYLPFNDTLNRFTLTVKNLETPYADVFWGKSYKRFSREELEKGVNLADAFAGKTPFQAAWAQLNDAVRKKQELETFMIKNIRASMRNNNLFEDKTAIDQFWNDLYGKTWAARAQAVAQAVKPVEHTITVKPSTGEALVIKAGIETVDEAKEFRVLYDLDLNQLKGDAAAYSIDNSKAAGDFSRVAYYLELGEGDVPEQWIWISMDAFTKEAGKLGVPSHPIAASFQQEVKNMTVRSNADTVKEGTGFDGWIEFWPNNYNQQNSKKVPNASDSTFDWGDNMTNPVAGYGCMQVHNPGEKQVLFALNNWRGAGPNRMDLGIGNQGSGNPDYTFAGNSGQYKYKRLRILVK